MKSLNFRVTRVAAASLFAGISIGFVGGLFRYGLDVLQRSRLDATRAAHQWPHTGWLIPVIIGAVGAGVARALVVRFSPQAEGSGIQLVEAVIKGEVSPPHRAILPVKFFGGLLALGSGLVLGREGPTVQMGASLAALLSRFFLREEEDCRIVEAAGAGAGLAVAFNAPVGGSVFVFEELTGTFSPLLLIATMMAAAVATGLMRLMLGNTLDFKVQPNELHQVWRLLPFFVLGTLLGVMGVFYNKLTMFLLHIADISHRVSSILRAALVGAVVGLVAWFLPLWIGGGDLITQAVLSNHQETKILLAVLFFRFLIGPLCYATGVPGGLFTPILVLGASFGALYAALLNILIPGSDLSATASAIVGMAALFAACVQAPLTGIILTVEMTGRGDLTLGLLAGALGAMLIPMILGNEAIYESLRRRMLHPEATREPTAEKYRIPVN
jgi:CIC family chloride channel protein